MLLLVALLTLMTPVATPPATPTPVHAECRAVPVEVVDWISLGLDPRDRAELSGWWTVKSDDFNNVWFVAATLTTPASDDPVTALWATNAITEDGKPQPTGGGLVLSVNNVARAYTDWFDARTRDISEQDDGASEAVDCAASSVGA